MTWGTLTLAALVVLAAAAGLGWWFNIALSWVEANERDAIDYEQARRDFDMQRGKPQQDIST